MKRAVLYARVSGDDRSNEGRNLIGQLDMCREHAQANGWQIVAELSEDDRGVSGASFELPQLNKALEMASTGTFNVLVVREIDRLSRRLAKQLIVEEEFNKYGVQIEYVLGDYPDTPEGALMKNVRAVIAEYERFKIIERMDRGRRLKAKSGSVLAYGQPPYGYKLVEEKGKYLLEVFEPEARIIRQIFEWYSNETKSLAIRGITRKLTELKVPTYLDLHPQPNRKKNGGFGRWETGTVNRILRNETYAGVWHFGKEGPSGANPVEEWIGVNVPPIVSRELWEAAQRKLDENRRYLRRKTKYPFLLAKRLRCGECGCRIYTKAKKYRDRHYLYYSCHGYKNVNQCNIRESYRADWLDSEVWKWVRGILSDPASLEQGIEQYRAVQEKEAQPIRDRIEIIDSLLIDNKHQLSLLLDLYLAGKFEEEILIDRKHRLEANIIALERERQELLNRLDTQKISEEQLVSLQQFVEEIAKGLEEADNDLEIRREIIARLHLEGTLNIENGKKGASLKCLIGERILSLLSSTTWRPRPARTYRSERRLCSSLPDNR